MLKVVCEDDTCEITGSGGGVCEEDVCEEAVCEEDVCEEDVCEEGACEGVVCEEVVCEEVVCEEVGCEVDLGESKFISSCTTHISVPKIAIYHLW